MKIAVVIMIVAMVARAQGLRCAMCVHQTGEEIIKMAEVTEGQFTEQDCKPTSVVECNPDYGEVCLSIFMTFTTIVDGQTKEDDTDFFICNVKENVETEQDRTETCGVMEMLHKSTNAAITDFTCRIEFCEDDGCNYEKEDEKEDEKESDAKSYVSSETRAGTSIFLVGIFSFFI